MKNTTDKHGNVLVHTLAGPIDTLTVTGVERQLQDGIDAGEKWHVVDLARVDYLGSAALRVFLQTKKRLASTGDIRFCGLGENVRSVFDVTGLSLRLAIFPSRDEALCCFPPPKSECSAGSGVHSSQFSKN